MHIDKPVFCFQINSEIHKYLGLKVDATLHRRYLRASLLGTTSPHYAGHAQVIECFHDCPEFIAELAELSRVQLFVSLSRQSDIGVFLETRRKMYEWDRSSYPMYFDRDLAYLKGFPTVSQGDPSTTSMLRRVYGSLYRSEVPDFDNRLSLEERRLLESNAQAIRNYVNNEDGALTSANFRRIPELKDASALDRVLSKVLPSQFTSIYQGVFEGFTSTGLERLQEFEDERSFPYLDYNLTISLLIKLGLERLVLDHTTQGMKNFIEFRLHQNFPEFVRAKENLLYLMTQDARKSIAIERQAFLAKLRSLQISKLHPSAHGDPGIAAIEIYKAGEQLCNTDQTSAARKVAMPDAQSWKGKYLIITATTVEDRALHDALTARGYTPAVIDHREKFTLITRFRSDVGKVFHLRTSAGSGGASGAIVMGKNAIEELKPQFVVSVGICFGLDEKKQQLCDVVVSEMIHDYERQRVSETRPEDRGASREAGPVLLSRARANAAVWQKVPIHFGTVTSGEKLVDSQEFRDHLKKLQPPAIAGDMEAAGLSAVCHETQTQFIMVKGICDWGFNKDKDCQSKAAQNACDFVLDALVVG